MNLIGSASLPLPEVCHMEGLPATACRAEGHRDDRLFPATEPVDLAEALIEEATRRLFGLGDDYAVNGQPHAATQANHAVFQAILGRSPTRPVFGLSSADGGHISHRFGLPSGTDFIAIPLLAGDIDYGALARQVARRRPAMIVAGGTSYTRAIDYARLREITDHVGAHLHADLAHTAPFVAAGRHPATFPFVDSATIDTSKNLRGPRGGILVYRTEHAASMRRAIFPVLQSSPNQNALLAKAACLSHWSRERLEHYTATMLSHARILSAELERDLGAPVYGDTDTHLLLFDLAPIDLGGREAERMLELSRILVNRNLVPGAPQSPWSPRGIRLATTALAILGYTENDVAALGAAITSVLRGDDAHEETIDRLLMTYHRPLVSTSSGQTS